MYLDKMGLHMKLKSKQKYNKVFGFSITSFMNLIFAGNLMMKIPVMFFPMGFNDFVSDLMTYLYVKKAQWNRNYVNLVLTAEALVLLYKIAKQKKTRKEADEEMMKYWNNVDYWAQDQRENLHIM